MESKFKIMLEILLQLAIQTLVEVEVEELEMVEMAVAA